MMIVLALSLTAAGCADETKSGLPADKAATELSSVDAIKLCKAIDVPPDAVKGVGAMTCLLTASLTGTCDPQLFDQCVAAFKPSSRCDEGFKLTGCQATVGEIEACYDKVFGKLATLSSLNCQTTDALKQANIDAAAMCPEVHAKCPAMFDK